jgi:amidase
MRSFTALSLAVVACVLSTGTEAATNPFPMPKCHGFTLEEATIDTIQARLKSGRLTSHQLVECYVDRVNKINPFMKYVL